MPKLGTLLEKLFKKAGIEINDQFKPLVELDNEIDEESFNRVDQKLLTVDAAKSHPDVLRQLRQNILDPVDKAMERLITEHGITVGEDYAGEQNTYEKIQNLFKTVIEAGKKPGKEKHTEDFAAKEAEYNKSIRDLKELLSSKETEFKTTRENDRTAFELQKILLGKDYVFPKEMDSNIVISTALSAVNNDLSKKGFVIKLNEAGQLQILNKDGMPAYNTSNEALEPITYIDGVLAHNKMLKVSDPNPQALQGSNGIQIPGGFKNASKMSLIDAEYEALP